MRHINIQNLVHQVFSGDDGAEAKQRLRRAHIKLARMDTGDWLAYTRRNGPGKWTPIKAKFADACGNKCWYTEVEAIGFPLSIDHYRPICDYWWLAYDAENYRVACAFSNSPAHNSIHNRAGGKGDNFPLFDPGIRATGKNRLRSENPVILDPCSANDCALLAFQTDGRPVLNPEFANDSIAIHRIEENKILLNLDLPAFNSKREQLCLDIVDDVCEYEDLPDTSPSRERIINRLKRRIDFKAPFSTAARYYLQIHRHLDWVEDLLISSRTVAV